MARAEIPVVALGPQGTPAGGASVQINLLAGSPATVYAARSGTTTLANPLTADAYGNVAGYVERGTYVAVIAYLAFPPYSVEFDAAPAADGSIDTAWLADLAVTDGKLASSARVTTHAALKTGTHGIPAMTSGNGLIWDGTDWVDTNLATQAELDTHVNNAVAHPPPAWITPTLTNGWTNYGSGYATCQYRKDPSGFVEVKGLMTDGTAGSQIFLLPVGYRPLAHRVYATSANNAFGVLLVFSAGSLSHIVGSNLLVSLEPVQFYAEA